MLERRTIAVTTRGRGLHDLSDEVLKLARLTREPAMLNAFLRHTSASLVLTENADPAVHRDLDRAFGRLLPDGDPLHEHADEGPDDMPAHLRSVITAASITIPVQDGSLLLGRWQGLYLWEHRLRPHRREVVLSLWS